MITDFAELLAMDEPRPDSFTVRTPGEASHLFGGLTFGYAARAAARTVDADRQLYAATCQYVGGGRGGLDLEIAVERVRDGRKLSLRRVKVTAEGRVLFTGDAWFAPEGDGPDWQPPGPGNDLAEATVAFAPLQSMDLDPLELRSLRSAEDVGRLLVHPYWARSRHPIGADRSLDLGALAFLSDLCTVGLVAVPGTVPAAVMSDYSLTLNHTLWVHRPFTVERWLRVDGQVLSVHGDRGLASGSIHDEDGALVASFSQEATRRA
jgi:acyl-CoA thioesterase-2